MGAFTIQIDGDVQLARRLSRVSAGVRDFRPAWEQIVSQVERIEEEQFSSQGAHGSGGWQPLSPAYAAWKARNFGGGGILVRTGRLRSSLTRRNPDSIREVRPLELRFGTRVPYAAFHQRGTRALPERKPIELSEGDRREIVRTLQRYLVGLARHG